MSISATEKRLRTKSLRRDVMKEPDDVSAMLRLKSLGWGACRIATELGCSRTTALRWLKEGTWHKPSPPSRPKALDDLEAWLGERFRRHVGNADVLRQELWAEKGIRLSLCRMGRAMPHLRQELRAEARAMVRFGTQPGGRLQIDFA